MPRLNVNTKRGALGKSGEDEASLYLRDKGFIIIERNFECRCGEIDIVAVDVNSNLFVFAEVKTRRNLNYGVPSLSVIGNKQKHIRNSANVYMLKNNKRMLKDNFINNETEFRFDILEVLYMSGKRKIEHIEGAFE